MHVKSRIVQLHWRPLVLLQVHSHSRKGGRFNPLHILAWQKLSVEQPDCPLARLLPPTLLLPRVQEGQQAPTSAPARLQTARPCTQPEPPMNISSLPATWKMPAISSGRTANRRRKLLHHQLLSTTLLRMLQIHCLTTLAPRMPTEGRCASQTRHQDLGHPEIFARIRPQIAQTVELQHCEAIRSILKRQMQSREPTGGRWAPQFVQAVQ